MRPGDGNARQVPQALADGVNPGEPEEHSAFLRSPGAPGDAHLMIRFSDDDDHEPWKTAQPAREDHTQTVMLGAAELQVTPMASQARTGGGHAL